MNNESTARIRCEMRRRQLATRPELAKACGLSSVTVGHVVRQLCQRGELQPAGQRSSGGGRPVQLYRFNTLSGVTAIFRARGSAILHGSLELRDLGGQVLRRWEAHFAQLQAGSLNDWLDSIRRRYRLASILLDLPEEEMVPAWENSLCARYKCPVRRISTAMALAEQKEGSLCLCLPQRGRPSAALYRNGRLQPCGPVWLLPLPVPWEEADYEDRTLVEELVSLHITTLCCTLAPQQILLYSEAWTPRLTARIRFNSSSKMHGAPLPALSFRDMNRSLLEAGLQRQAQELAGLA